jgi:hypothetical protein
MDNGQWTMDADAREQDLIIRVCVKILCHECFILILLLALTSKFNCPALDSRLMTNNS